MKSCCIDNNCIKCCLETRMPLSNQDIKRITKLGFDPKSFVKTRNGWLQLKNKDGRCFFHSGTICMIYKDRPEGCKLYPIIYDKDENSAVFDRDCPYRGNFKMSKNVVKKLYALISKLEIEKNKRNKKVKINKI